jgi:hypothetical protein
MMADIITALLGSQFSRVFSGLTTAYLITFAEYFTFYGVIMVWHTGAATKKQGNITKKQVLKLSS